MWTYQQEPIVGDAVAVHVLAAIGTHGTGYWMTYGLLRYQN